MRKLKKILCMLLAAVLLCAAITVPVSAAAAAQASVKETASHRFYQLVDRLISLLGKVLNTMIPGADWAGKTQKQSDYKTADFYPGSNHFSAVPAQNAGWRMGFAKRSFLTDIDPLDGSYYMAGTLEAFEGRVPSAVLDDQGVNAFALSDGITTVVYAAVDGYGLARGDVLEIRRRLASFAAEHGIASINVAALHQHSCIDTLGFGAPLALALIENPASMLLKQAPAVTGRNAAFMESLYAAVAAAAREAVLSMVPGALYYGSADAGAYMKDKREPIVFDGDIHRLRFVPETGGREIWVCEAGIHPVSLGAGTDLVSGDYPHYLEAYVNAEGAQAVFFQGAELAITSNSEALSYDAASSPAARAKALGEALGAKLASIENETALPPVLHVTHRELFLDIDNQILTLAGREGLLGSVFVKKGLSGYAAVTEIGYMELGGILGTLLVPGEIEPAILWGNAPDASLSWNGETWDWAPLKDICGAGKLICFGLCNDQIGYILCDNDVRSMLTQNEEINAASTKAGSTLAKAYGEMFGEIVR